MKTKHIRNISQMDMNFGKGRKKVKRISTIGEKRKQNKSNHERLQWQRKRWTFLNAHFDFRTFDRQFHFDCSKNKKTHTHTRFDESYHRTYSGHWLPLTLSLLEGVFDFQLALDAQCVYIPEKKLVRFLVRIRQVFFVPHHWPFVRYKDRNKAKPIQIH